MAKVNIASYTSMGEALVARATLEQAGIPCYLVNENLSGIHWLYSQALGMELQVEAEDAQAALELLQASAVPEELEDFPPATEALCPQCGSPGAEWVVPNIIAHLSLLLLFFLPFPRKKYRCPDCGHKWK